MQSARQLSLNSVILSCNPHESQPRCLPCFITHLHGRGRYALLVLPAEVGKDMVVTKIDKDSKTVALRTGEMIKYEALISTLPLHFTLAWTGKKEWADGLTHK